MARERPGRFREIKLTVTEVPPTVADKPGTAVAAREEGALRLQPGQTLAQLSPAQQAGLAAIFNFDPFVEGANHVEVFLHFCLTRGYDPFLKEAYLIKRGKGDNAKYTIQTGIDGFRRKAHESVGSGQWRYVKTVGIYWTGDDDGADWWILNPDTGIKKRVWVDAWIYPHYPAAAKCVIEYVDEFGNTQTTDRVAHWGMFAPYTQPWDNRPGAAKGKKLVDDDGKPVMVLGEMWVKGPQHQLGKCAEAQVLRATFPAKLSGLYIDEEMHKADVEASNEDRLEAANVRQDAFIRAQGTPAHTVPGSIVRDDAPPAPAHPVPDEPVHTEPEGPGHTPEPEPAPAGATQEQRRAWLLDEIEMMSDVLGRPMANVFKIRLKANLDEVDPDTLASVMMPFRATVIAALNNRGDNEEAGTYAAAGSTVMPVDLLLGHAEAEETMRPVGDTIAEVVDKLKGAPVEPHQFYAVGDSPLCHDCGEEFGDQAHTPTPGGE